MPFLQSPLALFEQLMAAYHSTASPGVYHSRRDCSVGSRIEKQHRRRGSGGRPLCWECIRLGTRHTK